ncbi:PAS domain S-box protein [Methylomonas sp. SURF-2]|uniref:histidine kinase n=1 Tax=Methylomonas subterranea TaxID=2952225 RepID=A0ABT1TIC4_9GAMM|nr:PAS domain S-box protein [Methylomonas sp. SURF-2]MCQ8105208.1 PAS domain S-box protein [Methylomonas sp. SURF-2]
MQGLFSPAVAVMDRLSFGKKNLLLSILSLLAILAVIAVLAQRLDHMVQQSRLELQAVRRLEESVRLVNKLQKYRGLSMAVSAGPRRMAENKAATAAEVDRALRDFSALLPTDLRERFDYAAILSAWRQIRQAGAELDAEAIFAEQSRLVARVLQLHKDLTDHALLPGADSYFLKRLLSEELPEFLEEICQLRERGIMALASKNLGDEQRAAILAAKNTVEAHADRIDGILSRAGRANPALEAAFAAIRDSLRDSRHLFTDLVLPDILSGQFGTDADAEYFVSSALMLVDTSYRRIFEHLFPATVSQVQSRIDQAYRAFWSSVPVPSLLFGLWVYLAVGAHLSASRRMAALVRSTRAFAGGDFSHALRIDSRDELGQMADGFNRMAAGFKELLRSREQNEKRLQSIINSALDAVVQMNADGVLQAWNRQAEEIFGWKAYEVIGKELHGIIIPERLREAHRKGLQHYLAGGGAKLINRRIEIVGLHKSGHEFPIELTITPNQMRETVEFSAFIRDISSQRQALKTLRDSELRYRLLFESSRDAIITLGPAGGILSGNPAAIGLFGCKDEAELISQDPVSLSPPFQADGRSSADAARSKIRQAMAAGFIQFEWLHRRLSGENFVAEVQLSHFAINQDSLLQATVRDITEQKRAKTALLTSESRFRGILRTMADAVVQIDAFGHILLVNDATLELFGYQEDELMGANINLLMPEPYRSRHDEYLKQHRETRNRVIIGRRVEFDAKHKNGDLIPIELSVNELMDDEGHTYIGVIQDIRKRKASEQSQEIARREAEHLAHVKSEFLANMSHEIRTPLNAIIGLAKIALRERAGTPADLVNSQRIHDAGMHLLNVVNDILDFSKIEAGKMTVESHPFHLSALIEDALSMVELRAREKQLQLVVEKSPQLPAWVAGDAFRIRQILVNLLSNAVKFTEQGYVSLSVSRERDLTQLTVSDSGIGISAEQAQRLFAAFEQADGSTTRKFGGSGLGLAISRNLAKIMGGDITVRSQLGTGSQFCLSLPLPAAEPPTNQPSEPLAAGSRLAGLRILAADDVELNRLVLEDLLVHEGAHVILVENGLQALERLEEIGWSEFDMVLMDIQMPLMDGYQATRKILSMAPDLPVIGLTAHAMPEERQRCLEAGMRERVTKPIDAEYLLKVIRQNISNPPQVQPLPAPDAQTVLPDARPAPESTGLIDWKAVRQRFDGRREFIRRLIDSALDGTQQGNLQKLRQASLERNFADIKFLAHGVKGFAGVFQAPVLMELAQATEKSAKDQDPSCPQLADQLADCLTVLLTELQQCRETDTDHES